MAIEVSTPEQVSEGIRELKEAGVDFLKFTYQGGDYWYFDEKRNICKIDKTLMQQIIREGKENGLNATAHVFYYDDVKELNPGPGYRAGRSDRRALERVGGTLCSHCQRHDLRKGSSEIGA